MKKIWNRVTHPFRFHGSSHNEIVVQQDRDESNFNKEHQEKFQRKNENNDEESQLDFRAGIILPVEATDTNMNTWDIMLDHQHDLSASISNKTPVDVVCSVSNGSEKLSVTSTAKSGSQSSWSEGDPVNPADIDDWLTEQLDNSPHSNSSSSRSLSADMAINRPSLKPHNTSSVGCRASRNHFSSITEADVGRAGVTSGQTPILSIRQTGDSFVPFSATLLAQMSEYSGQKDCFSANNRLLRFGSLPISWDHPVDMSCETNPAIWKSEPHTEICLHKSVVKRIGSHLDISCPSNASFGNTVVKNIRNPIESRADFDSCFTREVNRGTSNYLQVTHISYKFDKKSFLSDVYLSSPSPLHRGWSKSECNTKIKISDKTSETGQKLRQTFSAPTILSPVETYRIHTDCIDCDALAAEVGNVPPKSCPASPTTCSVITSIRTDSHQECPENSVSAVECDADRNADSVSLEPQDSSPQCSNQVGRSEPRVPVAGTAVATGQLAAQPSGFGSISTDSGHLGHIQNTDDNSQTGITAAAAAPAAAAQHRMQRGLCELLRSHCVASMLGGSGGSGGGGGRLLTKRQGAAQVVQIVGKMAPQAVSPKHGKSVDESCHSELPNGECDCGVSDASAVCEQDDCEKLQLEAVGERLTCGQQQSRHLLEDTQRLLCRLELLKDELQEEQEERRSLQRLHETLDSQHEQLQQFSQQLQQQLASCRQQLSERQTLLKKHGLVMVGGVTGELTRGEPASLVSSTSAQLLLAAGSGSLESRIRRLASERNLLENKIEELRKQLEVARAENAQRSSDELEMELLQHQAERLRQDYADKLKKSELEQSSLQAEIHRLEAQVHRHRMHAQQAEANEDELRAEKRKLTKQLRESHIRIEQLESYNEQLNKRMDKLNAVLKELSAPPTQRA